MTQQRRNATAFEDREQILLVMGIAGTGKTEIALAMALDGLFLEADTLHSPENVASMSRGSL